MPFQATIHNAALSGIQPDLYEVALFDGDPTGSGTELSGGSYARKQPNWATPSSGSMSDQLTFDIPASSSVDHIALYDDASTMTGSAATDSSESWSSAGTADVTITVTATDAT
ncbi:MAG: phage tail fiber protein [Nocardioidaceae bacterium]